MSDEPVMTPITPEESGEMPPKVAPFGAAPAAPAPAAATPAPAAATPAPAAAAPAAPAAPAPSSGVSTIKLKPVIRKPMIRKPTIGGAPKPAAPASAPAAPAAAPSKKATQSLAAVSDQMPAQAVLRKTGIIAEGIITPAQQQAAKSKTSRISLESAIGVAPAKESPAPLKTIRLRRPTDLKPPAISPVKPAAPAPVAETLPPAAPAPQEAPAPVADADGSMSTQKKTLKIHRPSGLGVKRPTLGIPKKTEEPAAADVPDMPPADMGDVPELKPLSPMDFSASRSDDVSAGVPGWVAVMSLITTIAALLVLGVVVYFLYIEGVGPGASPNEMPFIEL